MATTSSLTSNLPSPSSTKWIEVFHPETNKYFYFLPSTGESQWTIPTSNWRKARDPASGRDWYYNASTNSAQWDIPTLDLAQQLLLSTTNKASQQTKQAMSPPARISDTLLSPPPLTNSPHHSPFNSNHSRRLNIHTGGNESDEEHSSRDVSPRATPSPDFRSSTSTTSSTNSMISSSSSIHSLVPPSPVSYSSSMRNSNSHNIPHLDLDFIPSHSTPSTPISSSKERKSNSTSSHHSYSSSIYRFNVNTKNSNPSSPLSSTHPRRFLRSSFKGEKGALNKRSPRSPSHVPHEFTTPSSPLSKNRLQQHSPRSIASDSDDETPIPRTSLPTNLNTEDENGDVLTSLPLSRPSSPTSPQPLSPKSLLQQSQSPRSKASSVSSDSDEYVPYVAPPSPQSTSKPSPKSGTKPGWLCGVCTTENNYRTFICITCNAPQPVQAPTESTKVQTNSILKIGKSVIADFELRGFFVFNHSKKNSKKTNFLLPKFLTKSPPTSPTATSSAASHHSETTTTPMSPITPNNNNQSTPKNKYVITHKSKLFYFKSKTKIEDIVNGKATPQGKIKLRECSIFPNHIEVQGYEISSMISTSSIYKALLQRITYVQSKSKKEIKSELNQSYEKGGIRGSITKNSLNTIQLINIQGATLLHEKDIFKLLFQPYNLVHIPPQVIFDMSAVLLTLGAAGISEHRVEINKLINSLMEEVLQVPKVVYKIISLYLNGQGDVLDIRESLRFFTPKKFQKNLILLGTGESGKSTIFKQFYNLDDTQDIVSISCIDYMMFNMFIFLRSILQNMDLSNLLEGNEEAATLILEEKDLVIKPTQTNIQALRKIWADPSVKATLEGRDYLNPPFQCWNYSGRYALTKLETSDSFLFNEEELTFQDYLAMQCRTTGSVSITIKIPVVRCNIDIYDTGGQRNERKKWPLVFHENKTTSIIVVRLDEYNEVLFENFQINRMLESLQVFIDICKHYIFHDTCLILLFTFEDEFRKKIKRVPFSKDISIFKNFFIEKEERKKKGNNNNSSTEEDEADIALEYIKNLFLEAARNVGRTGVKEVPVYVTTAIDTETCRPILRNILNYIYRWHQEYQHAHLTLV